MRDSLKKLIRQFYIVVITIFVLTICLGIRQLFQNDTIALSGSAYTAGLGSGDGFLFAFFGKRYMPGFEGRGLVYKIGWPIDRTRPDWILFGGAVWGMNVYGMAVPVWSCAGIFALILARRPLIEAELKVRALFIAPGLSSMGLCPVCGYDVRATPERCPECGSIPQADAQNTSI